MQISPKKLLLWRKKKRVRSSRKNFSDLLDFMAASEATRNTSVSQVSWISRLLSDSTSVAVEIFLGFFGFLIPLSKK